MSEQARPILPAYGFAIIYVIALLCIPTRLIVGPLGAPGTPANLFAIAGLLWWLCAALAGLVQVRGLTPLRVAFGCFVALVLVSYAWGHFQGWSQPADIHQSSDRLWQEANVRQVTETITSASDRGLLALAGFAGILLITSEGVRSWRELDRVVAWLVRAATIVAAMGILQYFTGLNVASLIRIPGLQGLTDFGNALSRSDLNRIVATSAHPIELGVMMASVLPLALHRSLHSEKISGWLPTALIGVSALMSVSRSAIVVTGIALLILIVGWPWRWRLYALLAAPVLALVGRAVLPGLLGTVRSLFTGLEGDPSIQGRTDDYPLVVRSVGESPLFGQGLFTWVPMVFRTIDNQLLVLLLEIGVVGTVSFGVLVLTAVFLAWTPWRRGCSYEVKHLGTAISASVAGIVTSFATFDALAFRQVAGLTFFYMGLAGSVWWLARKEIVSASTSPTSSTAAPHDPPARHALSPSG
ncbi:O-antigen ligase family protein [Tessaracoccus sp. OS52]|uniref:O-antigen ligase family protein n=1 Tax=Tessaracoccus sp. OS52 TaxID=2886691 RepID=UPI001D11BB3F|nr:O-antigen ligase family protein [Tessaracoccus sp. OS52]MCC2594614.1 O-antigen ligase family protein [Tessaracoccus sp. OS52]